MAPPRGTTGGTPGYGTPGGYSSSKPANNVSSCSGGLAEAIYGMVLVLIEHRDARRQRRESERAWKLAFGS